MSEARHGQHRKVVMLEGGNHEKVVAEKTTREEMKRNECERKWDDVRAIKKRKNRKERKGKRVTEMAAGNDNGSLLVDYSGGACTLYSGRGSAEWGNKED